MVGNLERSALLGEWSDTFTKYRSLREYSSIESEEICSLPASANVAGQLPCGLGALGLGGGAVEMRGSAFAPLRHPVSHLTTNVKFSPM